MLGGWSCWQTQSDTTVMVSMVWSLYQGLSSRGLSRVGPLRSMISAGELCRFCQVPCESIETDAIPTQSDFDPIVANILKFVIFTWGIFELVGETISKKSLARMY
jgi:hypothetical protein